MSSSTCKNQFLYAAFIPFSTSDLSVLCKNVLILKVIMPLHENKVHARLPGGNYLAQILHIRKILIYNGLLISRCITNFEPTDSKIISKCYLLYVYKNIFFLFHAPR